MKSGTLTIAIAVALGPFPVQVVSASSHMRFEYQQTGPPGEAQQPMRVGGEIKFPQKMKAVPPVYPPVAQSARVEGLVIISATLGTDGKVADATIVRSVPLLDAAALDAVRQWEFAPTIYTGRAVPLIVTITLDFSLDDARGVAQPSTTMGGIIRDVNMTAGTFHLRESNLEFVLGSGTRFDPFAGPSFRLADGTTPLPLEAGQVVWVKTQAPADGSARRVLALAVVLPANRLPPR